MKRLARDLVPLYCFNMPIKRCDSEEQTAPHHRLLMFELTVAQSHMLACREYENFELNSCPVDRETAKLDVARAVS